MNDFDDRKTLAARVRRGGPIYDDEWEFLAECVERARPLKAQELTKLRDRAAAEHVIIMEVVGRVQKKAAVADAMARFRMARSAVYSAIEKHRDVCAGLEQLLTDATEKAKLAKYLTALAAEPESNF